MRKTSLTPIIWGGVPKLIAGKVPMQTHTNNHKDPNLPQLPADMVPKLQNGNGGQVKVMGVGIRSLTALFQCRRVIAVQ